MVGAGLVGVVVGAGLVGVGAGLVGVLVGAGLVGVLVGAGLVGVLVGAGLVGALLVGALVVGAKLEGDELVADSGDRPSDPAGAWNEAGGEGAREEECRGTTLSTFAEPLDLVGTCVTPTGDCPLWEELLTRNAPPPSRTTAAAAAPRSAHSGRASAALAVSSPAPGSRCW